MKTLVIEDDFVCRKLITAFVSDYGTNDVAASGEEGLAAFQLAHDENDPYDLICLDINMGGIDGHQTLEAIRAFEDTLDIKGLEGVKVIMTTSNSDPKSVMAMFKSGCEAYVIKPVSKTALLKEIHKLELIETPV